MLAIFLQGAALGLAAAASPGAFQAFLINQSLVGGWRRGAWVAFSPLISDPPIVLAILFLLNRLPAEFITYVSLAGGGFALYMAWGLWRQQRADPAPAVGALSAGPAEAGPELKTSRQVFLRGALMNMLSPGPYTFWTLVLGPLLLELFRQSTADGLVFLGGFYLLFIGGMLGLAILFHQARRFGPRAVRLLALASILILAAFGGLLLWRGIHALLR
jgi:threonine/homoserine/homoserine lactone efflux protein